MASSIYKIANDQKIAVGMVANEATGSISTTDRVNITCEKPKTNLGITISGCSVSKKEESIIMK